MSDKYPCGDHHVLDVDLGLDRALTLQLLIEEWAMEHCPYAETREIVQHVRDKVGDLIIGYADKYNPR